MTTTIEQPHRSRRPVAVTPSVATSRLARFEELDSLRGLAALVVFFYHCILLLAIYPPWLKLLTVSPLTLLVYGGHQAVILFFVLSGFVLYLPFARNTEHIRYGKFITRRICRIYLPYLFSVIFALVAYLFFFNSTPPQGVSELYGWRTLSTHRIVELIRDQVFFVGFFKRDYFNGPTWTLAEEMRISFIFPLIAMTVRKLKASQSIILAITGSGMVSLGISMTHHRSPLETLHYACLFALGAVLASNLRTLCELWLSQRTSIQALLATISLLACAYAPALHTCVPTLMREEATDWLIALTVSVFLIISIAGTRIGRLLRHPVMLHCGRTSYGIYLLHLPILFACVNAFWSRLPHPLVYAMALALTLLAAHVFYRFIEVPSIALGKRLTSRAPNNCQRNDKFRVGSAVLGEAGRTLSES